MYPALCHQVAPGQEDLYNIAFWGWVRTTMTVVVSALSAVLNSCSSSSVVLTSTARHPHVPDRQLVLSGRPERLHGVLRRAVADQADDRPADAPVAVGQRDADRG